MKKKKPGNRRSTGMLSENSAGVLRKAFFLAYLVESAGSDGLIRKNSRQIVQEAEEHGIFSGSQSNIWLHTTIAALRRAGVLGEFDRLGRLGTLQRKIMGQHYWLKLRNPARICRLLAKIPRINASGEDQKKITEMHLEEDPQITEEEHRIQEAAFEQAARMEEEQE